MFDYDEPIFCECGVTLLDGEDQCHVCENLSLSVASSNSANGAMWHLVAEEFDGVHVTEEGQWRTRLSHPLNLYGWDCESTVWFRWAFSSVRSIGTRTFEERPYED